MKLLNNVFLYFSISSTKVLFVKDFHAAYSESFVYSVMVWIQMGLAIGFVVAVFVFMLLIFFFRWIFLFHC